MKTIHKFTIAYMCDEVVIKVPQGFKPLTAQVQGSAIAIWGEVDTDQSTRPLAFFVRGTGHRMPDEPVIYIGTVQMMAGNLVWHVFCAQKYEDDL